MLTQFGWYGIAVASILIIKLAMSVQRRKKPTRTFGDSSRHSIAAVITVYNEDPAAFRACLLSLLAQTRRPDSVTVIDDYSRTRDAEHVVAELLPDFQHEGVALELVRFPVNRGKRHGLAAGFTAHPDADIYLCVDSDTVLDTHALAEAAVPFSRRRVMAVTGLVLARNRATNLLTRLIDMRYANAFLGDRVAYSKLGSVLCVCGSLALYRGWVARKYLDDFLNQRFLGQPATFGDDRRLTYYALIEGQALIQPTAVAYTDVPEKLTHFLRQQTRWTKSFIREGMLLLVKFRVTRAYWWLNLVELVTWLAFTSALLVALVVLATSPHTWPILAAYTGYVCAAAWLRSVHYLRRTGEVPAADRIGTFAAAPLYALMNLTMLIPLRLWALATLRDTRWGTRENGAEIQTAPVPEQQLVEADTVAIPRLEADTLALPRLDAAMR